MLRAMFAGFGSLLSVMDKVRSKSAPSPQTTAPQTTEAEPETSTAPEAVADPAAPAATEPPAESSAVTEPADVTAQQPTAEPAVAEPKTVVAEPETGSALPLANYDEASVASLRARLRNLSVAQLTQLVEYEKSHADRADVIAMFERRIAKVQAES
jgi:hypothetical protein